MGFTAYILEALNRYGKVDLGPLGVFELSYSPAKWQISRQNFVPPISQLTWSAPIVPEGSDSPKVLTGVIAHLHDIPFEEADIFCKSRIESLHETLKEKDLDLLPLGKIIRNEHGQAAGFIKYHTLDQTLRFEPLRLHKLYRTGEKVVSLQAQWLMALVSALVLGTILFMVNKWIDSKHGDNSDQNTTIEATYPAKTSIMNTNVAPILPDSTLAQPSAVDTLMRAPATATVITGTFCQRQNASNMKRLIKDQGFELYEEKLQNDCVRLGVKLIIGLDYDEKLKTIRNKIEPSAWVLDQ